VKITHFNGFINSIDSSLLEDQYFNIYMKHKHSNFKRLTSFNERRLLANFLELPLGEDFSKHRDPMNMKELIEKTWANWGMGEEKTPEQLISENWQKLVGKQLSIKCAPERLNQSSGILFIKTASGPVMQELSFQKKTILAKINKLNGCSEIKNLKFT
jgi:hypothetical protein